MGMIWQKTFKVEYSSVGRALFGVVALMLSGCVVPAFGPEYDERAAATITVGETTRNQVLTIFEGMGGPNVLNHEKFVAHTGTTGLVIFILSATDGIPFADDHNILIAFDKKGVVSDVTYLSVSRDYTQEPAADTSQLLGPPRTLFLNKAKHLGHAHCDYFLAAAFSSDSRLVAFTNSSGAAYIWDLGGT